MQTVPRLIESFRPEHYNLSITLDREGRTFEGTVSIEGKNSGDLISLHSKDLAITEVLVDGKSAEFTMGDNDQLDISQPELMTGKHIVVIGFSGKITDPMHGIYPCYYEHDGVKKELLATQFESHHAREVFPCVDEPEAKATFDLTLTTETGITVLGNMPVEWQREEDGGLVTKFQTTPRMSSYLLAWVTGELHRKAAKTKNDVDVSVWATPAQSSESLDFALDIAIRVIDFFDDYFGVPYPLPKADHVALPDFSSGAMENWGLITYRETALLTDPDTTGIGTRRYVATVIAHELSHQWFGNLVTMRWWNDLWLNESFANMIEYFVVDRLFPEWDIWLEYMQTWELAAIRRDAIDGVQPVQVDVHHPDEINTLFDGAIVYGKGGRLLRMLQRYIGDKAFQKGLKSYFKKYAYANTEGNDLWEELSLASGKDISGFMNTWISQPGYPVVHVTENGLSQEQFFIGEHTDKGQVWPIPLQASSEEDVPALLETKELHMPISPEERINVDDTAHFLTHYAPLFMKNLLKKVQSNELRPLDRLQLLNEQLLLTRGQIIPSADIIPIIDAYKHETHDDVWGVMSLAIGELKKFVEDDEKAEKQLRKFAGNLARNEYTRLGWEQKQTEPESDTRLRPTIIGLMAYSEDKAVIETAKKLFASTPLDALDPELRPVIISVAVRHTQGTVIVDQLLKEHAATSSAEIQGDIAAGVTSTKNQVAIDLLIEKLTDTNAIRMQDTARWFVYLMRSREAKDKAWTWMCDNWQWIEDTFGGDKSYDDYPRYAAGSLTTRKQLNNYKKFFESKQEIPALNRAINLGIKEIEGRVELIERDGEAVRKILLR